MLQNFRQLNRPILKGATDTKLILSLLNLKSFVGTQKQKKQEKIKIIVQERKSFFGH
jgi:hypothetical protein